MQFPIAMQFPIGKACNSVSPVESGMLHQCISVPILNDHFAAHTGKALRVILVFSSHLQTEKGSAQQKQNPSVFAATSSH